MKIDLEAYIQSNVAIQHLSLTDSNFVKLVRNKVTKKTQIKVFSLDSSNERTVLFLDYEILTHNLLIKGSDKFFKKPVLSIRCTI